MYDRRKDGAEKVLEVLEGGKKGKRKKESTDK